MWRIDVATLVEDGFLVGSAVAICVFENQDAIACFTDRVISVCEVAVVDDLANPNTTTMIDVDSGRA